MKTLPQWINQEAWELWVQFRKEIRKPLKPTTIELQLKMLEKHKANHVQILETSIQNGWQGLFPPKEITVKQSALDKVFGVKHTSDIIEIELIQ